jgi:hypothetical protein
MRSQFKLFELLRHDEVDYIKDNWLPKKKQVLHHWVNQYPNLGANSNQRSEGGHPKIKQILNRLMKHNSIYIPLIASNTSTITGQVKKSNGETS